jgi:hypothetical protein
MQGFPVWLFLAGTLAVPADLSRETILLQRARNVMSGNLQRLPNYTCLQTIERYERAGLNRKARLIDVVRIEVALVNGKELFAWPGTGRFVDTEISDLVKGGAIGTGNFALHAKAVFQTSAPRFTYAGEVQWNGRLAHRWDFVVAQRQSGYTLRVSGKEAVVGYHGSFWADKQSLDLLRLEVQADDIPPELGLDTAADAVEYGRANIGSDSFLLPARSELRMTAIDRSMNENRTRFASCRQYTGESTLLFDDPDPAEKGPVEPARILTAPPDLRLDFALQAPVVLREAANGDPVTGVLRSKLRLPDGTVIAKEALVHGRIASLRQAQAGRHTGYAIGLKFFELESGNIRVKFSATLEDIQTAQPGFRTRSSFGLGVGQRIENEDLVGSVFFVQSNVQRLDRGLRMFWRTTNVHPEDNQ